MEQFFTALKKRKLICIFTLICVLVIVFGGYLYYQQVQKQKLLESMSITFTEVTEIEYGTKDFDVQKELVKEVKNAKIKTIPKIDTNKIGKQTLKFSLVKDGLEKEVAHTLKIKDTKAPVISFKEDTKELFVGDEFDITSNIESVIDTVDGDIAFNGDALELNKKATEEYNKLKKKDIKKNTKISGKSLDKFLIENIKDKKENILYLKNCYYIDGIVDAGTAGEYIVTLVAVDKNGLKSESEFKVIVKERVIEQPQNYNNNYSSNNSIGNVSSENTNNGNITKGSKQDIINTALAQVGKPYVRNTQGPDSFDCSGLIYYAYTQNGWSIPRRISAGGTRIGSYSELQPGDIIYMPSANHVALFIGNDQMVEALNPEQAIRISSTYFIPNDTQFIRY